MGKQTHIVATLEDEEAFLRFVRETADIALFESFAPTADALWKQSFEAERSGHYKYCIWNRAFPWTPEYGRVGPQADDPKCIGWYYVSNTGDAPVVEFDRSDFHPVREGRVYWARDFSAPRGLDYDVAAFSRWYDSVVRWIRKHGRKLQTGAYWPYYLPDAWARREELAYPCSAANAAQARRR
jgi:hypothetical protein